MTNDSVLTKRYSARDFSDQPVALATLKQILTAAQQAPSWENTQPWKVYLATGETAKQLRATHAKAVQQQQKSWTEVVPPQEWAAQPKQNMTQWLKDTMAFLNTDAEAFKKSQQVLFNAPVIAYITVPKGSSQYSAYDAGAFGYGLLLAAFEQGVFGVPAYEFVRFPKEIRAQFDIPEDEALLMGIGLGYPKENKLNAVHTNRVPLDEILQVKD